MPTTDRNSAVLWDLDGTLVDSEEFHWFSWRDTLHPKGIDISYEQFLASFGQRNDRILADWLGKDADPGRIVDIGEAKEREYRRLVEAHGLQALPGAERWLGRLRDEGWKQAIASSAPRENVTAMLRALGMQHYFDGIVAAEDVTRGKPDPQVFQTAARKLGVAPERCVVVEDAAAGVEAARRAGMRSVGVSRGAALGADVIAASLADLPDDTFDRLVPQISGAAERSSRGR